MATLNGLPRSWDSFIQGICVIKKLIKFNRLWEECTQEEARLVSREENMGTSDDQALTNQAKKKEGKREDHCHRDPRNSKRIIDQEGTTQILDATHAMINATSQEIILEIKDHPRKTKRRGIMHILQKMMNLQAREQENILQVIKNMF